nr:MAG TPA: hypothetical protein [Caudoviricetes sp.]
MFKSSSVVPMTLLSLNQESFISNSPPTCENQFTGVWFS